MTGKTRQTFLNQKLSFFPAEERRRQQHELEARDAEVAMKVQSRLFSDSGTPPLPTLNGDVPEATSNDAPRRIVYNDEQYQVKLARPALVKDEPVYANNKPEHYAVSGKYPGGAISKIPAVSPRRSFLPNNHHEEQEDNVVGLAGLSQKDLVISKRAEEQLEQEKRDELLAKRLQQQLEMEGDDTDTTKFVQEAQDLEYAKMLQAKEKAKIKRAKERKRQKKLLEQQQQLESQPESSPQSLVDGATANVNDDNNDDESVISAPILKLPARKPYMNTGAIDSHPYLEQRQQDHQDLQVQSESELSEPQYANVGPNAAKYFEPPVTPHVRQTSDDGLPIPPYMPMQQPTSKRSTSLEKRIKKKKEKEGCKQQ